MNRNQKLSTPRILLIVAATMATVMFVWDFTPRASMKGKGKGQEEGAAPKRVSTTPAYRSPSNRHKLIVSNGELAKSIEAQGAHFIADYGAFRLLEVNDALANSLGGKPEVQFSDESNLIMLNSGALDTSTPAIQRLRQPLGGFNGKRMHLVQFAGPVKPEWYNALLKTGVEIVTYIPSNAYLIYGTAASIQRVQSLPVFIQWDGEYTESMRVDPSILQRLEKDSGKSNEKKSVKNGAALNAKNPSGKDQDLYAVQLLKDTFANAETLSLIEKLRTQKITNQWEVLNYLDVVVHIPAAAVVDQLAKQPDVVSIQPYLIPQKFDERQNFIIAGQISGNPAVPSPGDWLTYLASKGFTQAQFTSSNFAVNISDSGLDDGTQAPNHFALYTTGDPNNASRVIYNRLEGTPNTGSTLTGLDGHGTLNSHIIMGYVPTGGIFAAAPHADVAGFRYGIGVAPFVKVGSSVIFDPNNFTNPNEINLESRAYADGARISSNSWGANSNTYNVDSQNYDTVVRDAQSAGSVNPVAGNQEMVVVFAAGNAGSGAGTVGQPGTAKNVITAGASENVQAFGGADGCGIADVGADNANDIISFSGRGPTSDGRKKPELVAPGTHITGGVWQTNLVNPVSGNGLSPFNGNGVCGGTGGSNFFPAGQQWYTGSSGTSHSTPAIAGAAALVRQYFINQLGGPPSAAMTKAVMMNSARYLIGTGANDTLWSNNQGMGALNLDSFFDIFASTHVFKDQLGPDRFTASGQQRIVAGTIGSGAKPFRVTLAWTDVPGPTSGNAFVNNLDLEVTVGGNTYKGNVFSGANSATGGTADIRNNVESVLIPAGVTGTYFIKVIGSNIAGDGVPNDGGPLDQDYALVVYNGSESPVPVLSGGTKTVTAESCAPSNSAVDPGETVTVDLGLANIGTGNTTNLVATLQSTGGVSSPSGPQNYGALTAGGSEVVRSFSFTSTATCGQTLTATLQLQDGATDLGTVSFTFQVGTLGLGSTVSYSSGNIATPIPDLSFVEVPIVVSQQGAVGDMNVKVRLNHTFDGDLSISLIAPDGTTVDLANKRGGSGDDYGSGANDCSGTPTIFDDAAATAISAGAAPFAGSFRPDSPLSAFNGTSVKGTWKLRVTDNENQDIGTIGCVTLEVVRQPYLCCGVVGTPDIAASGPATITAESITPNNSVPDPGETVTATFPVVNVGDGATSSGLVGTLQTSGGVTPVGSPNRTYGIVNPGGPPVSQPFTFSAAGACGSTITATIHFQDGALDLGDETYQFTLGTISNSTSTFSNTTPIVIPASGSGATTGAPATPYPSNITVAGIVNPVTKVTVTLKGFQHTFPDDVDFLLVGPTGRKFILTSDAGGDPDLTAPGVNITLDDAAAAPLPDAGPLTTGTFRPSNFGTVQDPFPGPAPAGPYLTPAPGGADTLASAFAGQDPNGTWSLYVVDDANVDTGTLAGGWELTITHSQNVCNTQACSLTCPANITVPADGGGVSAVVNYPNPTVTGACQTINAVPASGSTFPVGTTTVNVATGAGPACSFTVTVTGGTPPLASTSLAINEFRLRGALGALDEYIEIVNVSGAPFTVNAGDGSAGWSVAALDAAGTVASIVATIPNGTIIPTRGHYLIANNTAAIGYSLSNYGGAGNATADATFSSDIADNTGVALFNTANVANLSTATRIDTVNFTSQNGALSSLFTEGTRLAPISGDGEYAFVRKLTTGLPKDTGDNAADFEFVSTTAGTFGSVLSVRGGPGPENLASPIQRNATVKPSLIDPTQLSTAPPNRVRDATPGSGATLFGTLDIRRKFTNNTGVPITRLRFRVVDITTTNTPGGPFADLRVLTSPDTTANGGTITIRGTAVEVPSDPTAGGGLNSSVIVAIPGGFLSPGATINVRYLLGVAQGGTFRFFVNVEALP